jgi:ankyrin repeat protein
VQMPLHNAAADGDVVNIRRLVAEGADVNVLGHQGGRPLHVAAVNGHVDAVRVLVEVGG